MKPDQLNSHPEGGHFKEVFRSIHSVTTTHGTRRTALTHIYFSLEQGEVSKFHKVQSDEVWNLYKGEGIKLFLYDEKTNIFSVEELSAENNQFCFVVPAGVWQAAEPLGVSTLVGCSVGPGFEFEDFELIKRNSNPALHIQKNHPEWDKFIPNGL